MVDVELEVCYPYWQ